MIDKAIEYIKEFFSKDSSGHDDTHTMLGTGENRQKVSSENRHFQSIKNNQS